MPTVTLLRNDGRAGAPAQESHSIREEGGGRECCWRSLRRGGESCCRCRRTQECRQTQESAKKYQQKKAEDLSLRNDALKQSISEHSHEVDEAHRAVASQQRKHKRDIEKMDEKLEKESNAKKRKQLDAAKDHDLYKYKMKCMKDELKKYKSLAEKETIARRNTEKKMTTMIHERQKMKKELEKREAEVRKLRDMLVCEKEKTKKANKFLRL